MLCSSSRSAAGPTATEDTVICAVRHLADESLVIVRQRPSVRKDDDVLGACLGRSQGEVRLFDCGIDAGRAGGHDAGDLLSDAGPILSDGAERHVPVVLVVEGNDRRLPACQSVHRPPPAPPPCRDRLKDRPCSTSDRARAQARLQARLCVRTSRARFARLRSSDSRPRQIPIRHRRSGARLLLSLPTASARSPTRRNG